MKKLVIVNVNLQYEVEANTIKEAEKIVENLELPKEYVEDSFEIINVFNLCTICNEIEDDDGRCSCCNRDCF